tara:strand:+ start:2199 stop:2480 length:282 start_codon:yes stop_codon:yes gene_type:complete
MKEVDDFINNFYLYHSGKLDKEVLSKSHNLSLKKLSDFFKEYYYIMKNLTPMDPERDWMGDWIDYGNRFRHYSSKYREFHSNIYIDLKATMFY